MTGGKLGVFRCDLAETGKCVEPFSTFVAFEAKASVSVWVFKWILTREQELEYPLLAEGHLIILYPSRIGIGKCRYIFVSRDLPSIPFGHHLKGPFYLIAVLIQRWRWKYIKFNAITTRINGICFRHIFCLIISPRPPTSFNFESHTLIRKCFVSSYSAPISHRLIYLPLCNYFIGVNCHQMSHWEFTTMLAGYLLIL